MATALARMETGQRGYALLRHARSLAASFRWALEVQRRCDRAAAGGRRLDGDTVRQIAAEADAAMTRR